MLTFVRDVTIVTAATFLSVAPGYYRAEQVVSAKFESVVYLRASGCAPGYGDPVGELCKLGTDVGSDSFFAGLFK